MVFFVKLFFVVKDRPPAALTKENIEFLSFASFSSPGKAPFGPLVQRFSS